MKKREVKAEGKEKKFEKKKFEKKEAPEHKWIKEIYSKIVIKVKELRPSAEEK